MKALIAAPGREPRFELQQIAAACLDLGLEVVAFDHAVSRDPTLELPALAMAERPDVLLVASPEREDPTTIELVRSFGARVCVWIPPLAERSPSRLAARRRWIARAADGVAVAAPEMASRYEDRRGRAARVLPAGFHLATLGIAEKGAGEREDRRRRCVAVRAGDDPLRIAPPVPGLHVVGFGDPTAFLAGVRYGGRIADPRHFAKRVAGARYLDGGRAAAAAPSLFADAAAAAAAGADVLRVPLLASIGAATPLVFDDPADGAFTRRLPLLPAFLEED